MEWILYPALALILALALASWIWRRDSIPCPAWLGWMVELDNPLFRNNNARAIVERLALSPGMQALDFGCGPGRVTIPLARAVGPGGAVTAFDIQPAMLAKVRARAEREALANIRFVQGAAGQGRLGRGEFDRAVLVTVLGEIPDPGAALREIFESLKPGGVLSITEVIADPHFQTRARVRGLAGAAGFRERAAFGSALSYTLNFEKP